LAVKQQRLLVREGDARLRLLIGAHERALARGRREPAANEDGRVATISTSARSLKFAKGMVR
jgi:hypothetical protein